MIIAPDDIFTPEEAGPHLRKSTRQVQRMLKNKELAGVFRNGRWNITAVAIWRYLGIEDEMVNIWIEFCHRGQKPEDSESSN